MRCLYCDDRGVVHGEPCSCIAGTERQLILALEYLQRDYAKQAQPYIDQLVRIRSLRTPDRLYVTQVPK